MMSKTIRTLLDTSDDLSTAVADLLESVAVVNATWEVLGDPSCFLGMDDDEMIAEWENDMHQAWVQEQWVLGYLDEVQEAIYDVNVAWTNLLTSAA
jgi:hypothetical protein